MSAAAEFAVGQRVEDVYSPGRTGTIVAPGRYADDGAGVEVLVRADAGYESWFPVSMLRPEAAR